MSSIVTAVFKATIGLLVDKGRDKAAEKLKDGDVTDQRFRLLIVREIDDIKSKLDGLARKDLLASTSFFKEGIQLLYEVFEKARLARRECGDVTAGAAGVETVSLAQGMRKLELTALDDSASRDLVNAKKRFKRARERATDAFANEALKLSDRVLALQYRVMATILETVDNPEDALAACRVCIEELHSLSAVRECFSVELKKGFWARISKEERRALISSVCHVNRVVYDVTLMVARRGEGLLIPFIETGEQKVDPLSDSRMSEVLQNVGMEHCCITPSSFGQEGEEEHEVQWPIGITTNAERQFIAVDFRDKTVKVFDNSGYFIRKFRPQIDDGETKLVDIFDVATDAYSNVFALVKLEETGTERAETRRTDHVLVFNSAGDQLRKFPVKRSWRWGRLTVSKNKVLVAWDRVIDVYENDGGYVRSIGNKMLKSATDIATGPDGRVLVLDSVDSYIHVFTEDGQQQHKFNIATKGAYYNRVACHPGRERVIVTCVETKTGRQCVAVYTRDGECQRTVRLSEKAWVVTGIAVSVGGRIVVTFLDPDGKGKVVAL